MHAASCQREQRKLWHSEIGYVKHGAFKTTSRAFERSCIARLLAASIFAVRSGEPNATFRAFQLSRVRSSLNARLKSGSSRKKESDITRRAAAEIPAAAAVSNMA